MASKNRIIGFSHGALHRVRDVYLPEVIAAYRDVAPTAIEICCNRAEEIGRVGDIVESVLPFGHRSIHAPVHRHYRNDDETHALLAEIERFSRIIQPHLVVVHPDLVDDWTVFESYDLPWAVENSDRRKDAYRAVGQVERLLADLPDWGFVLDLNHCYVNDASMRLADEFIDRLGHRVSEIHLSGSLDWYHDPLCLTTQDAIIERCRRLPDVPIIIESVLASPAEVQREFDYITSRL